MNAAAPKAVPPPAAVLARAKGENFPVASRILPPAVRGDLMAIYGFARLADELGDEGPEDRDALLDWLQSELALAYEERATHPLLRRLGATIRIRGLPREPFLRLIEANRMDQRIHEYETFEQLLGYCDLSANPVGELVLHVFRAATPERVALSDAVCTGLQLVEHWQDVAEDLRRGRVYLPREDLLAHGVRRQDLSAGAATPRLRSLMEFEVGRARELLDRGPGLARSLPFRAGLAVAAFVAGGRAAAGAIEGCEFDVLSSRPRASRRARAVALARTLAETWGR